MRIIRNFLVDVKESPWSFVQFIGVLLLLAGWCWVLHDLGALAETVCDDLHVIAEDVRNTE